MSKVLIYENRGSALNESSLIDNDAGVSTPRRRYWQRRPAFKGL